MAKNNNLWRVIGVIFLIGSVLMGVALTYGTLNQRVDNISEDVQANTEKSGSNERVIIRMDSDIQYIKQSVIRIESKI